MTALSWALWIGTMLCSLAAFAVSAIGTRSPRVLKYGGKIVSAGALLAVIGLVIRTVTAGHLPLFGTFENTYSASAFLLLTAAAASQRTWQGKDTWRLLAPWAVLIMLWGLRYRIEPTPVTISEQSIWVDIHVLFAWLAHSVLLWTGSLAMYRLAARRRGDRPAEEDRLLFMLITIGYVLLTAMICMGSWYLFVLFARFWKWEIVGVLAISVWIGYGLLIHSKLLHGLKDRALDRWAAAMTVPMLAIFWLWSIYPNTYHYFDITLVKP